MLCHMARKHRLCLKKRISTRLHAMIRDCWPTLGAPESTTQRIMMLYLNFKRRFSLVLLLVLTATANAQSPIAHYAFNGDSLTLQVLSDYALEGTIHGSPAACPDRFGNPTGAMHFAPGDYVTVPGGSSMNPLPFSVSVWYKPDLTANQGSMPLFKKYYPALWNGIMMYTRVNEGSNFLSGWYIRNSANRVISQFGSPVFAYQDEEPSDDMWRHAVFTVDSVEGRLYFDGQLQDVQPWDGQAMASTNSLNWQFAGTYQWADTLGYQGAMDDLTVWNHTLTEAEVWELYSDGGFDQNGCTDPLACNYDYTALVDNGLCLYPVIGEDCLEGQTLCADGTWWNPNDQMCHPFPCTDCPGDFNADHLISISDMLGLLAQFGETCEPAGCLDELACNYNPLVLVDDGSCVYGSVDLCGCLTDCQGNLIGDLDGDGICDNAPSTGCGDSLACNYSVDWCLTDSTLCIYGDLEPGSPCDDGDASTFNDVVDASGCNCAGTPYVDPNGLGPCAGEGTVTYFGHTYQTVEIGNQCWFAENLRSAHYANGDSIPSGLSNDEWASADFGAIGFYGQTLDGCSDSFTPNYNACDTAFSLNAFGSYYNFFAIADARGLCPSGWSVAKDSQWMQLETHLGMDSTEAHSMGWRGGDQGHELKSTSFWYAGGNGSNVHGFDLVPNGYRHPGYGAYVDAGLDGNYWTADEYNANKGIQRLFFWNQSGISRGGQIKREGMAVRCIKVSDDTCYDPDGDGVCAANEISGCTDETACNYSAAATHDDGSCIPSQEDGSSCDDGDDSTFNDVWDEDGCSCSGTSAVAEDGSGPCGGSSFVTYHGDEYSLVEIGDQCWFRQNLYSQQFTNGDTIPDVFNYSSHGQLAAASSAGPVVSTYGGNMDNFEAFGGLYNLAVVLDDRGICPSGWSVPDDEDWIELTAHLGLPESEWYGVGTVGNGAELGPQLRSLEFFQGENTSGFSALASGYFTSGGQYNHLGTHAYYWSSSLEEELAWYRSLSVSNGINRAGVSGLAGMSIRCVLSEN